MTDDTPRPAKSSRDASNEPAAKGEPLDERGPRPTDPNELAKWIVDQATSDSECDAPEPQAEKGAN